MIQARELMSPNPTCCTPETSIREAARLMREHDCGRRTVWLGMEREEGTRTEVGRPAREVNAGRESEPSWYRRCRSTHWEARRANPGRGTGGRKADAGSSDRCKYKDR